jgi:hypothetical protein
MGTTVAPLTSTVMGSVDRRHAGVASGVNNAISRAAGLLAVAALGALLVMRFNHQLDHEIRALSLPPDVEKVVEAQRSRLAAPDLGGKIDPYWVGAVRDSFVRAYIAGFRALMLTGAALAVLGAFAAALLVGPKTQRQPAPIGSSQSTG